MRKIQCADCGKHYDYDVDDFCPRCGSFNPPPDSGATRLEEELLSRFQGSGAGRPQRQQPSPRLSSGGRPAKRKRSVQRPVALVLAVAAILVVALPLVEAVAAQILQAVYSLLEAFR